MLTPYRQVLAQPGALAFSATGLLARLPISMVTLGIVLLVSASTGSYGVAGAVAASYMVTNALTAVPQGRLVDRLGQSRVLPWLALVFTLSLTGMMSAVELGWPTPYPHLLAAVAGATLPQIGACVRARWSALLEDKRRLHTAFALEAVVDESVFMIGPTLVTVLATVAHPLAGLGTAVVAGLAGTLLLAAQRGTEPPTDRRERRAEPRPPFGWRVLGPLAFGAFTLGVLFGGAEVATVAFSEEQGLTAAAGPLLAAWALGSLLSGFAVGSIRWSVSTAARYRWGILVLGLSLLPLPFLDSLWVMGGVLFVAGFAISPTLIASVAWVEETVPPTRMTEGIAVITTGLNAGLAPGAAIVGVVVDRYGASPGYWVPVAAVAVGTAVAFVSALWTGRGERGGRSGVTPAVPSPTESPS